MSFISGFLRNITIPTPMDVRQYVAKHPASGHLTSYVNRFGAVSSLIQDMVHRSKSLFPLESAKDMGLVSQSIEETDQDFFDFPTRSLVYNPYIESSLKSDQNRLVLGYYLCAAIQQFKGEYSENFSQQMITREGLLSGRQYLLSAPLLRLAAPRLMLSAPSVQRMILLLSRQIVKDGLLLQQFKPFVPPKKPLHDSLRRAQPIGRSYPSAISQPSKATQTAWKTSGFSKSRLWMFGTILLGGIAFMNSFENTNRTLSYSTQTPQMLGRGNDDDLRKQGPAQRSQSSSSMLFRGNFGTFERQSFNRFAELFSGIRQKAVSQSLDSPNELIARGQEPVVFFGDPISGSSVQTPATQRTWSVFQIFKENLPRFRVEDLETLVQHAKPSDVGGSSSAPITSYEDLSSQEKPRLITWLRQKSRGCDASCQTENTTSAVSVSRDSNRVEGDTTSNRTLNPVPALQNRRSGESTPIHQSPRESLSSGDPQEVVRGSFDSARLRNGGLDEPQPGPLQTSEEFSSSMPINAQTPRLVLLGPRASGTQDSSQIGLERFRESSTINPTDRRISDSPLSPRSLQILNALRMILGHHMELMARHSERRNPLGSAFPVSPDSGPNSGRYSAPSQRPSQVVSPRGAVPGVTVDLSPNRPIDRIESSTGFTQTQTHLLISPPVRPPESSPAVVNASPSNRAEVSSSKLSREPSLARTADFDRLARSGRPFLPEGFVVVLPGDKQKVSTWVESNRTKANGLGIKTHADGSILVPISNIAKFNEHLPEVALKKGKGTRNSSYGS